MTHFLIEKCDQQYLLTVENWFEIKSSLMAAKISENLTNNKVRYTYA